MKVYIITEGDYSDYHICAVTLEKKQAEQLKKYFASDYSEPRIEEYETDFYKPLSDGLTLYEVCVADGRCWTHKVEYEIETYKVGFVRKNKERYYVPVYAVDESHAKKIGLDKIAEYKAKKEGVA